MTDKNGTADIEGLRRDVAAIIADGVGHDSPSDTIATDILHFLDLRASLQPATPTAGETKRVRVWDEARGAHFLQDVPATGGDAVAGDAKELEILIREYDPMNSDWNFRKGVMLDVLSRLRADVAGDVQAARASKSNDDVRKLLRACSCFGDDVCTSSPCACAETLGGDAAQPTGTRLKYRCAHCGKVNDKWAGHVNRARARGLNLYCNRKCSGLGRRTGKTKAQRVEEKRLYDIEYRAKNLEIIKAKKKAHFQRTYDRKAAAEYRKQRMHLHVEYCRRPEYKEWKREYDRKYHAKEFGDFAEAYLLTMDLNREIKGRTTRHEVKYQNGGTNKAQRRKRQAQTEERGRNSRRSSGSGDPATHGW